MRFKATMLLLAGLLVSMPVAAQETTPEIDIQHLRPNDQRGINMFEPPKFDTVTYRGFQLSFGGSFTQQFQWLNHSNRADPVYVNGKNVNELIEMGPGFNPASANLYINAQLAPGIRVALTSYLSSRHHSDTWVKDGYLQIDALPIDNDLLETLMYLTTIKVGHFEVNYGDAHFRRTDNGNAIFNPFVGNYILDAFTTEIGAEVYFRLGPFMTMGGLTGGEIKGSVLNPDNRSPAVLAKLGFDHNFSENLRVRVMGSRYGINESPANTLFAGDRAGSRYYYVLENTSAKASSNFRSGLINPNFRNNVETYQLSSFVKYGNVELFSIGEWASGRSASEAEDRGWSQYASDLIYRFRNDAFYVAGRYNTAQGRLADIAHDVSVDRLQVSAGWFITPNLLMKAESVKSSYRDFPADHIFHGGKYDGFVVEGVVSF